MASKAIVGEKVGMTQIWDEQHRAVPVAVVPDRQAEAGQGHRLQTPGAGLPGQVQRPAAILDGLSDPAHPEQRR